MQIENLPLDDDTQVHFDFCRHGWSDLFFTKKGQVWAFRVSGVFTDFPFEVLNICKAIISNSFLRTALCDEPGGAVLELKPDKEQQHTVLLTIYEIKAPLGGFDASEEGERVLSIRIRRQRLIQMLMAELWVIHISLKQPSYQKGRSSFPHTELREMNLLWDESDLGPSFLK